MAKVSSEALREVQEALQRYEQTVEALPFRLSSKNTNPLHARHFVRWLADKFEPGKKVFP